MKRNVFVLLYLWFLLVSLLVNSILFWRDEHFYWSISGVVIALFFVLFIIGYFNGKRLLLWIGFLSIFIYSAYAIGALIWLFFSNTFNVFIIIFVIVFIIINIFILFHIKERLNFQSK